MIQSTNEHLSEFGLRLEEEIEEFGRLKQGSLSYAEWRKSLTDPNAFRRNPDYSGMYLNVRQGLRVVPHQPDAPDIDVLVVGGSTVFCRQNPDAVTLPAYLQQIFLIESSRIRVSNYGIVGGTVLERGPSVRAVLRRYNRPFVIMYFGVNECWHTFFGHLERGSRVAALLTDLRDKCRIRSRTGFPLLGLLADMIYLIQIAVFGRRWITDLHLVESELRTVVRDARSAGGNAVIILQPSILTTETSSESSARARDVAINDLDRWLVRAQRTGYKFFRERLGGFESFVDGSRWLSDQSLPVYIDWCHLNALGNKVVAERMFDVYRATAGSS